MSSTQIDKRYGSDPAKAKSRELVRSMIQRNLGYKKPQDLKVLCFPGNEATEVFQVYDPLGIPRGNIVGLEREKDVAEKIRGQGLGIQIVNQTLEDYVATQGSLDFDVVSLDYSGPLNEGQLEDLRVIAKKQKPESFLLHVANLAKRDRKAYEFYIVARALQLFSKNHIYDRPGSIDACNSLLASFSAEVNSGLDGLNEEVETKDTLIDHRGQAYSELTRMALGGSSPNALREGRNKLANFVGSKPIGDDPVSVVRDLVNITSTKLPARFLSFGMPRELALIATGILSQHLTPQRPLNIESKEKYSYISESSDPMIGDIYFLVDSANKNTDEIMSCFAINRDSIRLKSKSSLIGKILKFAPRIFSGLKVESRFELRRIVHDAFKEREFLGSSARPVLTKARAIEEFRAGATVENVRDKYRGVNGKPLAQWKAHVTMGSYDPKPVSDEIIVEDPEDSDLEKITKEEAIDLLTNGIPPKEIAEAYPTSFTKGQLAAFKAWMTMREQKG